MDRDLHRVPPGFEMEHSPAEGVEISFLRHNRNLLNRVRPGRLACCKGLFCVLFSLGVRVCVRVRMCTRASVCACVCACAWCVYVCARVRVRVCTHSGPQYKMRFSLEVAVVGLKNVAGEGGANVTQRGDCQAQKVRLCFFSGRES